MNRELNTVYDDLQRKHDSKSRSRDRAVIAGAVRVTSGNDGLMKDTVDKVGKQEPNHPVFYDENPANNELDNLSDDLRRKHDSKARNSVRTHVTAGATRVDGPVSLMNERAKIQLAMQTSEANMPGAVHHAPGQAPVRAKPSQFSQLNLFARLRRYAKHDGRGPSRNKQDDEERMGDVTGISNSAIEREPPDDLSSSMNIFKRQNDSMEESEVQTKRRRKMLIAMGIVGLLVVVSVVVGVVVGMNRNNNSLHDDQSSTAASAPNTEDEDAVDFIESVADCLTAGEEEYTASERFKSLQSIIVSELPGINDSIESPGNRTRAALCWLAEVDSFDLDTTDESVVIQRFALGLIYFHFVLDLDPESDSKLPASNWLEAVHECDWDYVDCNQVKVVTGLRLWRLDLGGAMPAELSLLRKLATLELSGNFLVGTIPSEIWTISSLETLNIELNLLTGTISDVGNLPLLRTFLAAGNGFTGTMPDFSDLPHLEKLNLAFNDELTGMFPNLEGAIHLAILALDNVYSLAGSIPTEIGMLTELRDLRVRGMPLVSGTIPTELGQLTQLMRLMLDSMTQLSGTVPSEIGRLTNLMTLGISFAEGLTGSMPPAVCNLRSQYSTELSFYCIKGDCVEKCPPV